MGNVLPFTVKSNYFFDNLTEINPSKYKETRTENHTSKEIKQAFLLISPLLFCRQSQCLRGIVDHLQEFKDYLKRPQQPGQKFTVDQQCQLAFGKDSYYCAVSFYLPRSICPFSYFVINSST